MAINKLITNQGGIPLSYHRIVNVQAISGAENVIEVSSYVSEDMRRNNSDAYSDTAFVYSPYDPQMTLTEAYEVIKKDPRFEGSDDILKEGDDPVAIALSNAKRGVYDPELVDARPADKEGFLCVPSIENLGYRVAWEFIADPEYDPEGEDGSFLKPFKYTDGMEVVETKWYWFDDKDLPHECIKSGIPASFDDTEYFDIVG